RRRDLPELLEPDAELLRLAIPFEVETLEQDLAEIAARPFREQRVFGTQLDAAGERILVAALLADAHVARGDTDDRAVGAVEHLGRGEAPQDGDARPPYLGCETPA